MSLFSNHLPNPSETSPVAKSELGKHASSPSKTPISSLQEWCQRLGKTPQYDLTAMEGRAHQPQFVYRCTVGDITKTGQGGSKKAAKHAAAEAVLNILKSGGEVTTDVAPTTAAVTPEVESAPNEVAQNDNANPVGTLQELVVARGWRLPVYSLYTESGPAHKKEFVMCCTVESFKEYGSGTAKKHAKRSAATKMYNKILNLPPDVEPRLDVENKGKPIAFDILHNSLGEKIQPIDFVESSNINTCQYLQKIAEISDFTVEYFDISDLTSDRRCQCMAMLNTQPAMVVHGEGVTCDDAHTHAASNAIKMLKIFFKRNQGRETKKEAEGNLMLNYTVHGSTNGKSNY